MSRPNAQVKWYKNRKELLPSKKYQLISQDIYRQLTIDDVCSSDEDTYTCDAGDDKTSCQLLVEGETPAVIVIISNQSTIKCFFFFKYCEPGVVSAGLMCTMAVRVEQAISIVREMSAVVVMEPEPALFQVETSLKSGRPPRWTLNGEVLEASETVDIDRKGTVHRLCFTSTDSSMSGPVLFVAGKSRSTAQLTVQGELPTQSVDQAF